MLRLFRLTLIVVAVAAVQPALSVRLAAQEGKIVPYVPTPQEIVDRMLEMAQVKKGDVVYDLGSGDGRIVVTAARWLKSSMASCWHTRRCERR